MGKESAKETNNAETLKFQPLNHQKLRFGYGICMEMQHRYR